MHISSPAVIGKIEKGELTADLTPFPDGTEVIVTTKEYFYHLAGSDSTRHQLEQAQKALEAVAEATLPEQTKELVQKALGEKIEVKTP